ncbi:MAG: SDR family NAD(P)-dependent oxidoreductase [Chlorobi bacterium]|nr:SDR family NAD(P)-dependent oxidoreductase [Chlorobiota bacterium]
MSETRTKPVVIITGANNGIGLSITSSLLEDQYCVAGLDLSVENLSIMQDRYPNRLRYYKCDVTDETRVNMVVASVIREWERIDILVNNACLAVFSTFEQKSTGDIRKEFEVNVFGYLNMIKAVLPYMKMSGRGIIHNIGSGVGITGFPGLSGYASAKGAIEAMTRTLAFEFESYGISVNLVHPPLTNTKSAAPLGIPQQMLADPVDVGHKLARRIRSSRVIVTPDCKTSLGLFAIRHFTAAMGKLLVRMTERAQVHEK